MQKIAITNAQVYNNEAGTFSRATILIEDEKIKGVVSPAEKYEDYSIIDAIGRYVTPGFIDSCSQIGLKEIGIRWEGHDGYEPFEKESNYLQVVDGIYPFDRAFQDAVAGGVTASHIVSSPESVIGARTAVIHMYGKTVDEMMLIKNLGYSFSMGDVPKTAFWNNKHSPLTRMGIALQIRSTLKKIAKDENIQKTPIFIRAHRVDDIETALRISKEFRLKLTIIHATEYAKISQAVKEAPFSIIAGPCFQPIERSELMNLNPSLYAEVANKHGKFTFATDHPVSSANRLQLEGALALKAGVSEKEILNGLTVYAAELLQIEKLTGSIKEGLFADLVIWNAHPLQLTARVEKTFIKGQEIYSENRQNSGANALRQI